MSLAGACLRSDGFIVPRTFAAELGFAASLKLDPVEPRMVKLSDKDGILIPPKNSASKLIGYTALELLFSRLSVVNVVRAVSCFLLEKHVVIISQCINALTFCGLCLYDLCRPFKFSGTFLPVLPRSKDWRGVLDCPVPYVCGLLSDGKPIGVPGHVVIVDLDHNSVIDPEDSPLIADAENLIMKLEAVFELSVHDITFPQPTKRSKSNSSERDPNHPPREWDDFLKAHLHVFSIPSVYNLYEHKFLFSPGFCDQIVGLFQVQLAPKLEFLIRPCFITDTTDPEHPVTVLNRELFIESVPPADKPFYSGFIYTTMFQDSRIQCSMQRLKHFHIDLDYVFKRIKKIHWNPNDLL
jgi:hypothetical protein